MAHIRLEDGCDRVTGDAEDVFEKVCVCLMCVHSLCDVPMGPGGVLGCALLRRLRLMLGNSVVRVAVFENVRPTAVCVCASVISVFLTLVCWTCERLGLVRNPFILPPDRVCLQLCAVFSF